MYTRLTVKYPLFLSDFNEPWIFSRQIFEKYSTTKFHETSSTGSRVFSRGQTDRQTDMTKQTVASRSFENAPKPQKTSDCSVSHSSRERGTYQIHAKTVVAKTFRILFGYSSADGVFPLTPGCTSSEHVRMSTRVSESCHVVTFLRIWWCCDSIVAFVSYFKTSPKMIHRCLVSPPPPSG